VLDVGEEPRRQECRDAQLAVGLMIL
jgi:hypothetical protein